MKSIKAFGLVLTLVLLAPLAHGRDMFQEHERIQRYYQWLEQDKIINADRRRTSHEAFQKSRLDKAAQYISRKFRFKVYEYHEASDGSIVFNQGQITCSIFNLGTYSNAHINCTDARGRGGAVSKVYIATKIELA